MFPLKKNCRLARLGEKPLHSKYKNEGGERFCTQKLPPPLIQKRELSKACGFCSPKPLLVAFCFHFRCFYSLQQVSIQSLSFFLSVGAFCSFWCSKLWEHAHACGAVLGYFLCLICWVKDLCEKALGLWCILKQWGMPHCPHSLAIYV